jgi:hypothetical protein
VTNLLLIAIVLVASTALWSVSKITLLLRVNSAAASARAYEASKCGFISILALLTMLFFIHALRSYSMLVILFGLDLVAWRLVAAAAIQRRDYFSGWPF